MRYTLFILCVLSANLFYGCGNKSQNIISDSGFITVKDNHFVDEQGRTIVFNGLNHVTKVRENNFLDPNDETVFRNFKEWGINCVRFGIYWDVLEPEPGIINEEYLKEIDKRVKLAEENGVWLILDMHQDLYGRKFGNGAPDWATLDEGAPHQTGEVWNEAYLLSPAIHNAFDNFWNNIPASDGIGIQDHYINAWKVIAKRYSNSPIIVGFDLMNEPYMGSGGDKVVTGMVGAYAEIAFKNGLVNADTDIQNILNDSDLYKATLNNLDNTYVYELVTSAAYSAVQDFEENILSNFYQRIRDSIRIVNSKHILFLEHNYFCNLGIPSGIKLPLDNAGKPDALCAYAPHVYDLVTDTDEALNPGFNRLKVTFNRIAEKGQLLNVPIVIGEWGAYYLGSKNNTKPAEFVVSNIEQILAGQTYWAYWDKIETQPYFTKTISRIYPMIINDSILGYSNDFETGHFRCKWTEKDKNSPTILYIPDLDKINKNEIVLIPKSDIQIQPINNSKAGYMIIKPVGRNRELYIKR